MRVARSTDHRHGSRVYPLVERLIRLAEVDPHAIAVANLQTSLTYEQLVRRASGVAQVLAIEQQTDSLPWIAPEPADPGELSAVVAARGGWCEAGVRRRPSRGPWVARERPTHDLDRSGVDGAC